MKKILLASLLCYSSFAFCQDTTSLNKTTLEKIQLRTGVLLKKEFLLVEDFKGAEFEILKIYDSDNEIISKGLRISTLSGIYVSTSYTAFLDADELDGLINFFTVIEKADEHVSTYTEYQLTTKGNMQAFAFSDKDKDWSYGLTLNKSLSNSIISFKKKDIDYLIKILTTSKQNLK